MGHTNPSDESHLSTNSLELSIRDGMQLSLNPCSLTLRLQVIGDIDQQQFTYVISLHFAKLQANVESTLFTPALENLVYFL